MLCSHSVQEAHDLALVSHLATLRASVPFVHFFDGFRTSHEINTIHLIDNEAIKSILAKPIYQDAIKHHRARALNPTHPHQRGTAQGPDVYFQCAEAANPFYDRAYDHVAAAMEEVRERASRSGDGEGIGGGKEEGRGRRREGEGGGKEVGRRRKRGTGNREGVVDGGYVNVGGWESRGAGNRSGMHEEGEKAVLGYAFNCPQLHARRCLPSPAACTSRTSTWAPPTPTRSSSSWAPAPPQWRRRSTT